MNEKKKLLLRLSRTMLNAYQQDIPVNPFDYDIDINGDEAVIDSSRYDIHAVFAKDSDGRFFLTEIRFEGEELL